MKNCIQGQSRFSLLLFFLLFGFINASDEKLFPVPDLIKPNVQFWKMVYSEVSIREGLLHDRHHPMVIYDKVRTNSPSEVEEVRRRREQINKSLEVINSQPEDSWGEEERRIVALFEEHASRDALRGASERVRFQRGQRERFISGIERSGMYLDTIRSILQEHELPLLLAYIPHVESSFDTEAYSKVGAAGLWQFMRATGGAFGMKVDYLVDERRDPIIATVGAARYLSNAYNLLGSWPVAITSYNHGVNGMRRAVNTTGSNCIANIIENYRSRTFGFASSNFYACFVAAARLAEDYQNIFPNVTLMPRKEFNSTRLNEYMNIHALISHLGLSQEQFRAYNPAIRASVYNQQNHLPKGFTIHVPGTITPERLEQTIASIPHSYRSSDPPRQEYHRVQRGENLNIIANRYGVSVRDIAQANNITRLNRIYAGQVLRIPSRVPRSAVTAGRVTSPRETATVPPPTETAHQEVESEQQRVSDIPEGPEIVTSKAGESEETVTKETEQEIVDEDTGLEQEIAITPETIEYRVRPGDNLTHIANRYGVSVQKLAKTNNIRTLNRLFVGQILVIPMSETPTEKTSPAVAISIEPGSSSEPEVIQPEKETGAESSLAPSPAEEMSDTLRDIAATIATDQPARENAQPAFSTSFDVNAYKLDAVLSPTGNQARIIVNLNETIGHYADWLGIPTHKIRQFNNMGRTSEIRLNSTLNIPLNKPDALKSFAAARLEYHMAIEEDFFSRYKIVDLREHVVGRGESVWDIIRKDENVIPLWLLAKHNNNLNPSMLRVGMKLWVPVVEER
ncbi:Membrane-bound lytic murein transglycosylase D precursor [Chitinispirillum alkaliphilum]|nr:Membrane-bound lytic murein transglycosylase D precursor [Chitinispirillum alkaliphilum]